MSSSYLASCPYQLASLQSRLEQFEGEHQHLRDQLALAQAVQPAAPDLSVFLESIPTTVSKAVVEPLKAHAAPAVAEAVGAEEPAPPASPVIRRQGARKLVPSCVFVWC